jgi:predicted RNA-binding Zn-ribbon protein involved in translation (DUF1610 family)
MPSLEMKELEAVCSRYEERHRSYNQACWPEENISWRSSRSEQFLGCFRPSPLLNFDFSLPCPLCGYKIQPNELMRLESHIIRCPKCSGLFDEMNGRKPISTS